MTKKQTSKGKAPAKKAAATKKKKTAAKKEGVGRGRRAMPKPGMKRWPYKPIKEEIAFLIEKKQPFTLIKYPIWAKQVTNRKEYGYELVLIQTKDREEPMDILTMTKEVFYELIEQYEMQQLYRSADGTVYGIDTRLREISDKLKKLRERPDRQIKQLRAIYVNNSYPKEVLEKVGEALDIYKNMLAEALAEFYKENDIIIWDFGTVKEKDEEETE